MPHSTAAFLPGQPTCVLNCPAKIPPEEARRFCEEQSPFLLHNEKHSTSSVECTYQADLRCEYPNVFIGICVKFHEEVKTYNDAVEKCKAEGQSLVSYTDFQATWVRYASKRTTFAVWAQADKEVERVLLLKNSNYGKASSRVAPQEDFGALPFYCTTSAHSVIASSGTCNMFKAIGLTAHFDGSECYIKSSNIYFGIEARGQRLHDVCGEIAPGAFAASPTSQFVEAGLKTFMGDNAIKAALFPSTLIDENDLFYNVTHKQSGKDTWEEKNVYGYIMPKQEITHNMDLIPDVYMAPSKYYPKLSGEKFRRPKVASYTNLGVLPTLPYIAMPAICRFGTRHNIDRIKCPEDYFMSKRYSTQHTCLKIIHKDAGDLEENKQKCEALSPAGLHYVSGFEQPNELRYEFHHWFMEEEKNLISIYGLPYHDYMYVYLGARMNPVCTGFEKDYSRPEDPCHHKNIFQWVDARDHRLGRTVFFDLDEDELRYFPYKALTARFRFKPKSSQIGHVYNTYFRHAHIANMCVMDMEKFAKQQHM